MWFVFQTLLDYKVTLAELLKDYGPSYSQRKIFIMVDGIDHLEDLDSCAQTLCGWLPSQLPQNVKLILTLRDGKHLQQLRTQLDSDAIHQNAFYQVHLPSVTFNMSKQRFNLSSYSKS